MDNDEKRLREARIRSAKAYGEERNRRLQLRLENDRKNKEENKRRNDELKAAVDSRRDFEYRYDNRLWVLTDIKDAIGQMVESSIDVNGSTIVGEISRNELRQQAALAHLQILDLQQLYDKLQQQLQLRIETGEADEDFLRQYHDASQAVLAKMRDLNLRDLDYAYKELYVNDNEGLGSKLWNESYWVTRRAATYEKGLPDLQKEYRQDVENRYRSLVLDNLKYKNTERNPLGKLTLNVISSAFNDPAYAPAGAAGVNNIVRSLKENSEINTDRPKTERDLAYEVINKAKADNIALNEEYQANRKHLADSRDYWNVSSSYKLGMQATQDDHIWSPYYWFYQLPLMIGSSSSSPEQVTGQAINLVATIAGVAAAGPTGGASLTAIPLAALGSTPLEWEGARDENHAEVADARIESIMTMLKSPDFTGMPEINEAAGTKKMTFPKGFWDNRAQGSSAFKEVTDELLKRSRAAWKLRGWTDEQIDKYLEGEEGIKNAIKDYISGLTKNVTVQAEDGRELTFREFKHPALQDALFYSTAGIEAQFRADMMRTAGEMPFQKLMQISPIFFMKNARLFDKTVKNVAKAEKRAISAASKGGATRMQTGKELLGITEGMEREAAGVGRTAKYWNNPRFAQVRHSMTDAFKRGYSAAGNVGASTGFGFVGYNIFGAVGGATASLGALAKQLSPRLAGLLDGITNHTMFYYQKIIDGITRKSLLGKTLGKYLAYGTGRAFGIGMSEAAEEAAQYLNSKEDFAGKYGWAGMSLADMIANDLKQGGRIFDAYLSLLGIGESPLKDDVEFWNNLKSGFMLGFLPIANMNSMSQFAGNLSHAYREYKTTDALTQSTVMNREYDKMNRASRAEFVRQAFHNRENMVMQVLDQMQTADQRRQERYYSDEDFEQRKQEAREVMKRAKDKVIRQKLEAKGIRYGTEEYATAIADIYNLETSLKENAKLLILISNRIKELYQDKEFKDHIQSLVNDVIENQGVSEHIEQEVKKSRDNAFIAEVDKIRLELGLDPNSKAYGRKINSAENKARIAKAMDEAENVTRTRIPDVMRENTNIKTQLVNRLKGLLDLKARHGNIEEFYNFLTSKFDINIMRPDASAIRKSINKQIENLKEDLEKVTKGTTVEFSKSFTDAEALDYILDSDDSAILDPRIEELESSLAMLLADRDVLSTYLDQFNENLVLDENGKWVHNKAQYKAEKNKMSTLLARLKEGDEEALEEFRSQKRNYIEPQEGEAENNAYLRRVKAIMEANDRNLHIKWAVAEITGGDAVSKLQEVLEEEDKKQEQKPVEEYKNESVFDQDVPQLKSQKTESTPEAAPKQEPVTPVTEEKKEPIDERKKARKEAYERRVKRVKDAIENQRLKYRLWKRGSLKSGIPLQDLIVESAFTLASGAAQGVLKFAQFVESMKDVLDDIDIKDVINQIKTGYTKRIAWFTIHNREALKNMSSVEEVMNYTLSTEPEPTISVEPSLNSKVSQIQEKIQEKQNKIIQSVSSYHDVFVQEEDGVHIYQNKQGIESSQYTDRNSEIKIESDKLKAANTSDESFRRAVIEYALKWNMPIPVDEYVKYRNVEGIEHAVIRAVLSAKSNEANQYVINGVKTRDAVIAVFTGKTDQLDKSQYPDGFEQFIKDLESIKANIEDLGFKIIDGASVIYGTSVTGERLCSQVDIIIADETGKTHVIDVRSGHRSLYERWDDVQWGPGKLVTDTLLQIESILANNYNITPRTLYLLPVIFNDTIQVEKQSNGRMLMPIKMNNPENSAESLEEAVENAKKIIDSINDIVEDYNELIQHAKKYDIKVTPLNEEVLAEYSTVEEYEQYSLVLQQKLDSVKDAYGDLNAKIQGAINDQFTVLEESGLISPTPSSDVQFYLNNLYLECKNLNLAKGEVDNLPVTEEAERIALNKLLEYLFRAQVALDEFLQADTDRTVNVSQEMQLITGIVEYLVLNKSNYGNAAMYVTQWWADSIVETESTNAIEKHLFYQNKIELWTNTINDFVINNIDNDIRLLSFYSSIVNNYFAKLLDNAEKFANSSQVVVKQPLLDAITLGRSAVQTFNEEYAVVPDLDFTGPSERLAESINKISTKWKNHHNSTTAVSPAFDQMSSDQTSTGRIYYTISTSPTFITPYSTEEVTMENKDDHTTRFTLMLDEKDGKVKLRINWWDPKGQPKFVLMPFKTDISKYEGKVSEEQIEWFKHANRAAGRFEEKVKRALEFVKKNPDYKITMTVTADAGSINYTQIYNPVTAFLFNSEGNKQDLYTIKLSKENNIGIARFVVNPDKTMFWRVDDCQKESTYIAQFSDGYAKKQGIHTKSGLVVYFYSYGDGNKRIGVPIPSVNIGLNDAAKLADLITRYVSGERMLNGFDILSLIKQRLYISDPTRIKSQYNDSISEVKINPDKTVTIGHGQPISPFTQRQLLISTLQSLPLVIDGPLMNENLYTSSDPIISQVRNIFRSNSGIKTISLPNGFTFNIDDFTHRNSDGTTGSTFLGYMLRNNYLMTRASSKAYRQVNIDNVQVVKKSTPADKTPAQTISSSRKSGFTSILNSSSVDDSMFDMFRDAGFLQTEEGLEMLSDTVVERTLEEQDLFVQQVIAYFDQVFGTHDDVVMSAARTLVDNATRTKFVVGMCRSSVVEMSKYAPLTAIWHEAFHKLIELVLPDDTRERMYKMYRDSFDKSLTDREVAEGLADLFVDYMQNRQAIKEAKGLSKVWKWFKALACFVASQYKFGFLNMLRTYCLYKNANKGKYKDMAGHIEQSKKDRFESLFGDKLFYTINGHDFENIADSGDAQKITEGLAFALITSLGFDKIDPDVRLVINQYTPNLIRKDIIDELTGMNVPDDQLTLGHLAFREVFADVEIEDYTIPKGKNKGKVIMRKKYPHFVAFNKKIADYIENIMQLRQNERFEEENEIKNDDDLGDNREAKRLHTDRYDKASYEFSKLSGANKKVKLFFATIPYVKWNDATGLFEPDGSRNKYGCPTFVPIDLVYNVIVNECCDVRNLVELSERLKELGRNNDMIRYVSKKFEEVVAGAYKFDEDHNVVSVDYDKELFLIQIFNSIRSLKHDFAVALSTIENGKKKVKIKASSMERDSLRFAKQWSMFLQSGQIPLFTSARDANGNYVFKKGYENTFNNVLKFLSELRTALFTEQNEITINGWTYDKNVREDVEKIKDLIISNLHSIAIMIDKDALDYMLFAAFGGADANGIGRWLNDTKKTSINPFFDLLKSFTDNNGLPVKDKITLGYKQSGFVKELANWQGTYNRITTQQMALGLNQKKLYSISQNSSLSHAMNQLNTNDINNEFVSTLLSFGYNVLTGTFPYGSIILKQILNGKKLNLKGHTYIGFKTDNKGDYGNEFKEENVIEDYISRLLMLQEGYLVLPTLADKGTYVFIEGVPIPGMQFIETSLTVFDQRTGKESKITKTTVQNAPHILFVGGKPYIIPSNEVLDQMIEYARGEQLAIQQCMEDLGYDEIPGYTKTGRKVLTDAEKVINYHTRNKVTEANGTRFLSLTKIRVREGNKIVTYNLNDPTEKSVDLLKRANDHFFNRPFDEQDLSRILKLVDSGTYDRQTAETLVKNERMRETMGLTLAIQAEHEVETAVNLGIVNRTTLDAKYKRFDGTDYRFNLPSSVQSLMNLDTTQLNEDQIQAVAQHIMQTTPHKCAQYKTWAGIDHKYNLQSVGDAFAEKKLMAQVARSLAIASILADATYRYIISSQEAHRCFLGHPGQFKVNYDVENHAIKDSAFDLQKRIGGVISTGEDNATFLSGIKSTYVCAECKDYEVSSKSDIAPNLQRMFVESHVEEVFANKIVQFEDQHFYKYVQWCKNKFEGNYETAEKIAYSRPYNWIKENAPEELKESIEKAEKDGRKFASSYDGGINVADGAAYITANMCKDMLRMRGAYNSDVEKAFAILESEDTKYSWENQAEAYKTIYDKVNLVSTKYTAYGFRRHSSGMSVAYYNKFALFPLFKCIATGKMNKLYQKMLDEGVDMLMMNSAVKVGSQGAVLFNGEEIEGSFNKYIQDYGFLRRQLNTDPEEGDRIVMGTQMVKIGLQNLRLNREDYIDFSNGLLVSGQLLMNKYMSAINKLAELGVAKITDMFSSDGGKTVDAVKLSEYLNKELSSRNANKTLIEAIKVVEDPITHLPTLNCPLAATPDGQWIESILISTINKHVIDITTPGSSFVQRSVFAMEGSSTEGGSIQSDTNMAPTINGGRRLLMINEYGTMDAVVSMDYFDETVFKGKYKDKSFTWKKNWLIEHGIIGGPTYDENGNMIAKGAKPNTIGYRIPTQAQSSIHGLRFVDVIPAVKATVILPEEFTKITGSDFDIDHLYMTSYNVEITEDGGLAETMSEEHMTYENQILDCLMTLLTDSKSTNSLYRSIDNDTELVKENIADFIPEDGSTKGDPYNVGTLHEQVLRRLDYITGKIGIGPFALNVTNSILTYLTGVSFKATLFTTSTGILRLDRILDNNDHFISSWMSAFINAHVDIVKDAYISKLNVNQFTYNTLNLLLRCGYGDVAVWFCAQPVIRDLANADTKGNSQFLRSGAERMSKRKFKDKLTRDALLKYMSESDFDEHAIKRLTSSKQQSDVDFRCNVVNWIRNNEAVLAEIAKNPHAESVSVNGKTYRVKDVQRTVYYAWKAIEKYARALGTLVQYTKIDTRKQGKSFIAMQLYLDSYHQLVEKSYIQSLWDMDSIRNLVHSTWIQYKTEQAINLPLKIMNNQLFTANKGFMDTVIGFGSRLQKIEGVLSTETLVLLAKNLATAIKSRYAVDYAKNTLNMTEEDIRGLFIGKNSVNSWLVSLKRAIETKPEYARFKNNYFLNQIYSAIQGDPVVANGTTVEKPQFITVLDNVDDSKLNSDLLTEGWADLMNDPIPNVRLFARKMVVYAMLTSGDFSGWNKMAKYIPVEWILGQFDNGQSFADYIKQLLNVVNPFYLDKYLDEIIANNYMDYRLSEFMSEKDDNGVDNFTTIRTSKGMPIVRIGKPVDEETLDTLSPALYITVKREGSRGRSVANYDLYKHMGFVITVEGTRPIYVKIKKRGFDEGGFNIYEYGWNFNYEENESAAFNSFDLNSALARMDGLLQSSLLDFENKLFIDTYFGRNETQEPLSPSDKIAFSEEELRKAEELRKHCEGGLS